MIGRPAGDIADAVLALHLTTVCNFDFESFDLFGELDTLGVGEAAHLSEFIAIDVQDFAHEINYTLGFVESSCGDIDVEHHFPL